MALPPVKIRALSPDTIKFKSNTYLAGSIAAGNGITVTQAAGIWTVSVNIAGGVVQPFDADLTAIAALSGTGFAARTALNTWAQRTITGTAAEITVSNGDGVSGDPTLSLPTALTLTGKTITGGDFASPTISGTATITATATASGPWTFTTTPTSTSTTAGAAAGPFIHTYRNIAGAADNLIGSYRYYGNNSTPVFYLYASIVGRIKDPTAASEDGEWTVWTANAGTFAERFTVGQGVQIGPTPTGLDKGPGTANVSSGYYVNNVAVPTISSTSALTGKTYNGLTITTTTGTFTIANGKTATFSNTLTLAGTDGSTLNIGAGGTLGSAAFVATGTSGATLGLLNANLTFSGSDTFSSFVTFNSQITSNPGTHNNAVINLSESSVSYGHLGAADNVIVGASATDFGIYAPNGINIGAGTNVSRMRITSTGVMFGAATGGLLGVNTVNAASGYYVNNVAVPTISSSDALSNKTSYNKVAITAPATSATITVQDGKTLSYEEGTWTPTLTGATTAGTGQTYTTQNGWYVKIGNLVKVSFEIVATSLGTAAGNLRISNLPFTAGATALSSMTLAFGTVGVVSGGGVGLNGGVAQGTTNINVRANTTTGTTPQTIANTGNTPTIMGTAVYTTSP